MDARIFAAMLCLAACNPAPPDMSREPPRSFVDRWRASAGPDLRLDECVLRIVTPNPEFPVDYQEVVRRVWAMRRSGRLPVFFTYRYNQNLFVILNANCANRTAFSSALEDDLHQNARLRRYRTGPASADEVRFIVSTIENDLGNGAPH